MTLWRTHKATPATDEPVTALLCGHDDEPDSEPFLFGIFLWRRGEWINEDTGNRAKPPFWWVPEDELVADLPRSPSSNRTSQEKQ